VDNLIVLRTLEEVETLREYLKDKDFIAYDTETTGVEKGSQIIGLSVCADVGEDSIGWYIITAYWDVPTQTLVELETKAGIKPFLEDLLTKNLIMQNAGFDCAMTKDNFGVDLMPALHTDTLLLGHLLNENRANGLKERGVELFGEDARKEQQEMKASVHANGGVLTKHLYELYKADANLIAEYGAKDAILTLKVFYHDIEKLYEEGLDKFFYEETMPLCKGPTYDMNTTGLRVDPERLQKLRSDLEAEILEARAFIYREIDSDVKPEYDGKTKLKTFNIGSCRQLSWLLFGKLENEFHTLTKQGKVACKALGLKIPYTASAKREFIAVCEESHGRVWEEASINPKTKKMGRPKKIGRPWEYIACGKVALGMYADKYKWVAKYLEYAKAQKLLNTYVMGIQEKAKYNIIRPNFLQHGTTSGRYSCKNPNFQNLPRGDKRVKNCIVARPGKVFVGADQEQLEPRTFASVSQDASLLASFKTGDDFYSVIGAEVFDKQCGLKKDDPTGFAMLYPKLRDTSKVIGLSIPYGTSAYRLASTLGKSVEESQYIIDSYYIKFPAVYSMVVESHAQARSTGVVHSLYGRPRRMPEAAQINKMFGEQANVEDLDYYWRNLLNLAVNHRIQSSAASIMNRAAIAFCSTRDAVAAEDARWAEVRIVMQVHDELIVECPTEIAEGVKALLQDVMENTTALPGVALIAKPKIASNLAELK
jgi:DNA polymerase I-like protein with 3'-5' exonuclease and polymerase domains